MNGNFEYRVCTNGSNEECKNASNGCLGELDRVNSYCYLGENVKGGGGSELAVTRRIGLGWKAVCLLCYVVKDTHGILKNKFIGHV